MLVWCHSLLIPNQEEGEDEEVYNIGRDIEDESSDDSEEELERKPRNAGYEFKVVIVGRPERYKSSKWREERKKDRKRKRKKNKGEGK